MSDERLRTIAVATDFSPGATAAFAWALELAREHRSALVLVHALLPAPPSAPDLAPVPQGYYRELRDQARAKLEALMAEVRPAGLSPSIELVLGASGAGILATAQQRGADVIVLGPPVGSRWARLVAGSTTAEIVRAARLPVLTVPAGDGSRARAARTVIVPTNFSADAMAAADAALRLLAPRSDGRLVLLHAVQASRDAARRALDAFAGEVRARAAVVARGMAAPAVRVDVQLAAGAAAPVVIEHAARIAADVIAMGTRGRSTLARLWLGSTAERVLGGAPCPVVTARAPGI